MNPLLAKDGHGEVDVRIEFQSLGLAADPWELLAAGGVPLAAHRSLRFISRGAGDALSRRHQWRSLRSAIPRIPDLEFKPDRRIRAMTDPAIVAWLAEFHRQRDLTPDPAAPLPETWQALRAALRVRASQQPERRPLRVRVIQP